MNIWLVFACSFAYVALRALQQRNVQHDNYWWVMPVSIAMSAGDVFLVANISQKGFHLSLVLAMGAGAGFGCMLAMWFHKRFVMRRQ